MGRSCSTEALSSPTGRYSQSTDRHRQFPSGTHAVLALVGVVVTGRYVVVTGRSVGAVISRPCNGT